jgi:hypothetical protein
VVNVKLLSFLFSNTLSLCSSLSVREEHRLRVFENRVLRIFGSKRD